MSVSQFTHKKDFCVFFGTITLKKVKNKYIYIQYEDMRGTIWRS